MSTVSCNTPDLVYGWYLGRNFVIESPRGHLLAIEGPPVKPTVTVEVATKWYAIYLLAPEDPSRHFYRIEELHFGVLEEFRAPEGGYFVDHCPNPASVRLFCHARGYDLDELGYELMAGRWVTEVREEFE